MKQIEVERRRRGLSQTELARKIRVHPSFVAHVEAGRWIPSPTAPAAKRLARFFGRSLAELLADAGQRDPVTAGGRSGA